MSKNIIDKFNYTKIIEMLDSFINYTQILKKLNSDLINKKIRYPNFPSEISENIVKLALFKKYDKTPLWDTKSGDLELDGEKIEVKAFSSNGPASFGPTENWKKIYFINCKDYLNKNFIIHEINLSNSDELFSSIKVNKNQTFKDQCIQGKRPRISFDELYKQIPTEYVSIIFEGNLSELE
jgi:hypothetical protein